jgi:nucleoid-associated protein YgaU
MGQWFLQWGWALALLVVAVSFVMMWYRSSVDAWSRSGGDWKKALALEVGPFITFAVKVSVGAMVMTWAVMYVYGVGQGSPISQSFYQLGTAGVSALSGSFGNVQVSIPQAPSLPETLLSNIPTEADLRNVFGVNSNGASPAANESAPAANEAANTTWIAPASAPQAPANSVWANPVKLQQDWGKQPVIGPQPQPTQGPALAPTTVPAPTQGPAEKPQGWNVTFGGGGPQAADADAAIAGIGAQTYTVKRGDSLSSISVQVYGNRSGWARICNANRNVIADCSNIRAGMVLSIPAK